MKKLFSFAAILGFIAFGVVSCDRSNDTVVQAQDNDTYATAYDLNNVSFTLDKNGNYTIVRNFNTPLIESDVVLIYRQFVDDDGITKWQSIPRTLYLAQGELDMDFAYNKNGITIRAGGTFDPSLAPTYINNQTFRVVVVPAATGKNANVDRSNYDSVASFYGISENNVKKL